MTGAQIAEAARNQGSVIPERSGSDRTADVVFRGLMFGAVAIAFAGLGAILYDSFRAGLPVISLDFFTSFPSRIIPESSGIQSAIVGTIYLMLICAVFVVPVGVATAVYLEEYADETK